MPVRTDKNLNYRPLGRITDKLRAAVSLFLVQLFLENKIAAQRILDVEAQRDIAILNKAGTLK